MAIETERRGLPIGLYARHRLRFAGGGSKKRGSAKLAKILPGKTNPSNWIREFINLLTGSCGAVEELDRVTYCC